MSDHGSRIILPPGMKSGILLPSQQVARVNTPSKNGMTYLDAFGTTGGRLPGNLDHKYLLVDRMHDPDVREQVSGGYAAWAEEIIAKAADGKHLKKGIDVKDAKTGWGVAASEVQKATGGDPYTLGSVLFIDPINFEDKNGNLLLIDNAGTRKVNPKFDGRNGVWVLAKTLVVVEKIQKSGKEGHFHKETGLIVKVKNPDIPEPRKPKPTKGAAAMRDNYNKFFPPEQKNQGIFYYPDAESVRTLVRTIGFDSLGDGRTREYYIDEENKRSVDGSRLPSSRLGVFELVAQLVPVQLNELASTAQTEIAGLPKTIRSALPASLQTLIDAIAKQ
ncbi:MAG: hypothetical protein Q7T16_00285 [Candidatus Burarchaeum sp.]|nr:hypothetical protein [Candidatus Burarchaeum sp.]MDO8339076.1 hypothetical protein [Candidatus Burarchaeum sp.]